MDFVELNKLRTSALNFDKDFIMTDADFSAIASATKLAPSTFNLQTTEFVVVTDKQMKDYIHDISFRQYKIKSAAAVVFVIGNRGRLNKATGYDIYTPMFQLGIIDIEEYKLTLELIGGMEQLWSNNIQVAKDEVRTLAGISTSFFIIAAKSLGFDTCPMHVHNEPKIRSLLRIPDKCDILTMIAIGKATPSSRPRGPRRPPSDLIRINRY